MYIHYWEKMNNKICCCGKTNIWIKKNRFYFKTFFAEKLWKIVFSTCINSLYIVIVYSLLYTHCILIVIVYNSYNIKKVIKPIKNLHYNKTTANLLIISWRNFFAIYKYIKIHKHYKKTSIIQFKNDKHK